ncbi:YqcI/YcgG family protein [Intrasporangium oryzae]|nr:YqcI/YcgG family protein [Intrasporangium oryzae]
MSDRAGRRAETAHPPTCPIPLTQHPLAQHPLTHPPLVQATPGEDPGLEAVLRDLGARDLEHAKSSEVLKAFETLATHPDHPCGGAAAVFRHGCVAHIVLDDLEAPGTPATLLDYLRCFAAGVAQTEGLHSFIVSFRGPRLDASGFDAALTDLLAAIRSEEATPGGTGRRPTGGTLRRIDVPGPPAAPIPPQRPAHVPFSAGGADYVVIGLHPEADATAMRAPLPTIVFNPRDQVEQFELLRRSGHPAIVASRRRL